MKNIVILPIHKKWSDLILSGEKTVELRKKPLRNWWQVCNIIHLHKYEGDSCKNEYWSILLYETKTSGGCGQIVGEVECYKQLNLRQSMYVGDTERGTCLTPKEFNKYGILREDGSTIARWGYYLRNHKRYDQPKPITEFGLTKAPQGICYKKVI